MYPTDEKYQELYRGVLVRRPTLPVAAVNTTPSLGIGFYIDPALKLPPVLELTRLSIDRGTQLGQKKQEFRELALWDARERDGFYKEALKGGVLPRFESTKRSHEVQVLTMLNLVMQNTVERFSQSIAGEVKSDHKEFSPEFLQETLMRGANDAYATAEELARNISAADNPFGGPKTVELAIRSAMRAVEQYRLYDNPDQLFQAITQETTNLITEMMDSARDTGGFVAAWHNENSTARQLDRYLRQQLPNAELLTVEPAASMYTESYEAIHGKRLANDFSGEFPLSIHWVDRRRTGGEERQLNCEAACQNYGFNISCAGFRKAAVLADRVTHGMPWAKGGLMFDSPLTQANGMDRIKPEEHLLPGTPFDLPVELAEKRLELLRNAGSAEVEAGALQELTEILDANEQGRKVDYRKFRTASMELPPAMQAVEGHTLGHLQSQLDHLEQTCRELADTPDNSDRATFKRSQANLQADELEYWISQHPDFQDERPASDPKPG